MNMQSTNHQIVWFIKWFQSQQLFQYFEMSLSYNIWLFFLYTSITQSEENNFVFESVYRLINRTDLKNIPKQIYEEKRMQIIIILVQY